MRANFKSFVILGCVLAVGTFTVAALPANARAGEESDASVARAVEKRFDDHTGGMGTANPFPRRDSNHVKRFDDEGSGLGGGSPFPRRDEDGVKRFDDDGSWLGGGTPHPKRFDIQFGGVASENPFPSHHKRDHAVLGRGAGGQHNSRVDDPYDNGRKRFDTSDPGQLADGKKRSEGDGSDDDPPSRKDWPKRFDPTDPSGMGNKAPDGDNTKRFEADPNGFNGFDSSNHRRFSVDEDTWSGFTSADHRKAKRFDLGSDASTIKDGYTNLFSISTGSTPLKKRFEVIDLENNFVPGMLVDAGDAKKKRFDISISQGTDPGTMGQTGPGGGGETHLIKKKDEITLEARFDPGGTGIGQRPKGDLPVGSRLTKKDQVVDLEARFDIDIDAAPKGNRLANTPLIKKDVDLESRFDVIIDSDPNGNRVGSDSHLLKKDIDLESRFDVTIDTDPRGNRLGNTPIHPRFDIAITEAGVDPDSMAKGDDDGQGFDIPLLKKDILDRQARRIEVERNIAAAVHQEEA